MIRIFLLVAIAVSAFAQLSPEYQRQFDEAERHIVRIPPKAFSELPPDLVQELDRRGCTIPQVGSRRRGNVIKGEFARPGQTDWAVLCSIHGVSRILVFWNGSEKNPAAIGRSEDRSLLQGGTPAEGIFYSREVAPVGKSFIMEHYRAYGGPKPPPIDHQGINDAFVEKASSVWYFYRGKWLTLTGSD